MRLPLSLRRPLLVPLSLGALSAVPLPDVCVEELPLAGTGGSGVAYGRSVAVDGDLAVVCGDQEAYAYAWNGTSWVQEALLTIPGAESGFGESVALDGSTVAIGLPLQDFPDLDAGRVLVFVRDAGGTWSLEQELMNSSGGAGDRFGAAVALDADRLLVGVPDADVSGPDSGIVRIFERTAGSWSSGGRIFPPAGANHFGASVALSGDTAVVSSGSFTGGVHVHVDDGSSSWPEQAQLAASLFLPSQVALEGERAVVGGLFETLVVERSGTLWTESARLPVSAGTVALDGSVLAVGGASCPSVPAASVWLESGGTWSEGAQLDMTGSLMPVAVSGTRVLVGTRDGLACTGGSASDFELDLGGFGPAVAFRNAGTNPDSYRASPASIGGTLELTIDLATTGHSLGLVIGFDSPFQFTLAGGQTLLCLDLLGSGGELINTGFFPGPLVQLSLPVPNDPGLVGFEVSTQAMHAFGVTPFALSNAQDLTIGDCP